MAVRSFPERRISASVGTNRSLGSVVRQSASSDLTEPATSPQETGLEARVRFLESRLKSLEQLQYKPAVRMERRSASANGISPFTVFGAAPEIRSVETDQTDPVGQFRWQGSAGSYTLEKALTALWATVETIFQHDVTNKVTYLNAITAADWYARIQGGNITTTGGAVDVGANAGIVLRTGDAAAGTIARMQILGNTATPDIDFAAVQVDLNGLILKGLATVAGQGTGNVNFKAYKLPTDGTAYRHVFYVLDPATDTEYAVAQAVPDGANPKFTMLAADDAPSTSELDADNIMFRYIKATDTLQVYVNEGGVIKTLAIGVLT